MTDAVERRASCRCGRLRVACRGEPVRISVCHCLDCQQRSGAAFAAQVRYPSGQVTVTGEARTWTRTGDSGRSMDFHFCPTCGSTVWFGARVPDGTVAVAIGAFADPTFPAPWFSVFESRKHAWVEIVGEGIEHD